LETPDALTPTDQALLERIAKGDRRALGIFATRHQGSVLRYARSLCRSEEQAEDALQQTFVDVLRGAASWSGRGPVRTWLLTLTRNAVYRGARRRSGEPAHFVPLQELGELAGWGADPETLAGGSLDRDRLRSALAGLSGASREVLVLRELEGLSGPETATLLGLSLAATKSRLHRARLELAAALRPEEVTDGP